jgi:hypothetical protein
MREVPSIPAGLDPKLRNVLSAVRESLNAAITNIKLNTDNLAGMRQWIQPALDTSNDLVTYNESLIQASLESATGADGAAGIDARAVTLTTPDQAFTYDTSGAHPLPASSVITATALNTVGVVYYEFFINDVSTGVATTTSTYTYTPQVLFDSMPDKLEVQIREDSITGPIEARDQMAMVGLRAGSHGIVISVPNDSHTLPRSTAGVVNYVGSGTKINVWEGANALTEDSISPYANSTFRVTAVGTGITPGATTGAGTTTLTYGDSSNMTTDPAKIIFTIIAKREDGTEMTFTHQQSLSFSQQGTAGAAGDSVDIVFVRSATQPATPTASPGTPTAPITWYTDVASVPASANPLWSSVGFKTSVSANYTWSTPVKIEGTSVAEVTVFTRGVPTTTPIGGTYTFSNPPVLAVPTSTGATWYTSVPSGTLPVYTSRAVVSTSAGNTSAVAITGWTVPVISFQNGNDGSPGSDGSRGPFTTYAAIGYPGWDSATAYAAIMAMPNNQSTLVVGDEVTLCYPNTTTPTWVLTKYVTTIGNPGTWTARGRVIDGNLLVTGSVKAAMLQASTAAISGTTMSGSGGIIESNGHFALGNTTGNITYNGTTLTLNGNVVGTGNIAAGAITKTDSNTALPIQPISASPAAGDICSISGFVVPSSSTGVIVTIQASIEHNGAYNSISTFTGNLSVKRNGSALANANATTVFSQTGATKIAFMRSIIDNPGAGTHTYSMATAGGWSFNAGGTYTVKDIQIQVMLVSR